MAYQTSHFPTVSALVTELRAVGFVLDYSSDFDTTYMQNDNTVIVDLPEGESFVFLTVHLICDRSTVDLLVEALRLCKVA